MSKDVKSLLLFVVGWRVMLFVFLLLGMWMLTLQKDFLGGGLSEYSNKPWLWAWVNFDGEHFLAVARDGYRPLTYFFFPLYPLLIRFFTIGKSSLMFAVSGLVISHISFILALIGFYKLIRLDYKKEVAKLSIILLLLFPTSFYFVSFYSESLFLALVIWSFYFARRGKWMASVVLGGMLTATRVVGLAIFPALIAEIYLQNKVDKRTKSYWPLAASLLTLAGFILYTLYLKSQTGDPFEFFHSVSVYGQQRQAAFIMLPQVFYRYLFKVLPNVNYVYFPVVFTTVLELITAIGFLIITIISFIKLRLSYAVYALIAFIIPTFSGSFSSLPRYVLVLFPVFMMAGLLLQKTSAVFRWVVFIMLFIGLACASTLFLRGYWVS